MTHVFPFKAKTKHLSRRRFHQAAVDVWERELWAMSRCRSCGWRGLGFYRFEKLGAWSLSRGITQKAGKRAFVLCDGCGVWKEVEA